MWRRLFLKGKGNSAHPRDPMPAVESETSARKLGLSISTKLSLLHKELGSSSDFILRTFGNQEDESPGLAIVYIDGLVDQKRLALLLETEVIRSYHEVINGTKDAESWIKESMPVGTMTRVYSEQDLLASILDGGTAVMIDGLSGAWIAFIPGGIRRQVEEPSSQTVIRGPKEGFTEEISTNISLLRRKLKTTSLRIESRKIGRYTQTKVAIVYLHGIANPDVVSEINSRLDDIDTDSILESGYIEEFIQDAPLTPFPTMFNTERPDAVAAGLLEGQVAILVDGTPFVLLAPVTFFKFFQSSEDYYQRYDIASFLRIIRLTSFAIGMLLPSLYIATTTYQQEMLPTTLLISLAAQREGTPLPALLEAFVMEITFEVIREAGVRMPRVIGPAISIVGALVLGQAAVQAGLVSGAMVIVVSFTAIANFVIPALNMSATVRLIRFILMFLAGTLGFFGILAGLVPILVHLVSLQTFGIPYFMPVAPLKKKGLKDILVRTPWWKMKTRPAEIGDKNPIRQVQNHQSREMVQLYENEK